MKKPIFLATKSNKVVIFAIFLIVLLSIAKVVTASKFSTGGVLMSKLEEEIHFYKIQNAQLLEKLLSMSSLTNIASKAAVLGFSENKSDLFVTRSLPIAIKQ